VSESGRSWTRAFKGHAVEAAHVRHWIRERASHPDAPQVAHELFVAVLGAGPEVIEMTISTAGPRLKLTATGTDPLPLLHSHGPGWRIIHGLACTHGQTDDKHGLWAQLEDQ